MHFINIGSGHPAEIEYRLHWGLTFDRVVSMTFYKAPEKPGISTRPMMRGKLQHTFNFWINLYHGGKKEDRHLFVISQMSLRTCTSIYHYTVITLWKWQISIWQSVSTYISSLFLLENSINWDKTVSKQFHTI